MASLIDRTLELVPLEMAGAATVPSLEELERLTDVPERRVVFRRVGWAFYEALVEFPPVTGAEVTRWVVEEDSSDESAWARRLRGELRAKNARSMREKRESSGLT